jgi:hypothetical protein
MEKSIDDKLVRITPKTAETISQVLKHYGELMLAFDWTDSKTGGKSDVVLMKKLRTLLKH